MNYKSRLPLFVAAALVATWVFGPCACKHGVQGADRCSCARTQTTSVPDCCAGGKQEEPGNRQGPQRCQHSDTYLVARPEAPPRTAPPSLALVAVLTPVPTCELNIRPSVWGRDSVAKEHLSSHNPSRAPRAPPIVAAIFA